MRFLGIYFTGTGNSKRVMDVINHNLISLQHTLDTVDVITFNSKEPRDIISDIIVFPSGAEFEIVNVELRTEGINNRFLYSDIPSVYLLTLKTFQANVVDETPKDMNNIEKVADFATQEFLDISDNFKVPHIDKIF